MPLAYFTTPVRFERELIRKHWECSDVTVQQKRFLGIQAIYRDVYTHVHCSKVLIHNLHLSVDSQFWHNYARTKMAHSVLNWTKRVNTDTHTVSQSRTLIKTKHNVCVNHCIHTCNAIRTVHKATHKAPGSHAAIHIQAKKTLYLTLHYLWDSSKGTHARLEMWIQTGGLHDHLHSKFSPASETIGDIQFSDNQLTEYSVIRVLQFRCDGFSGGFQTTNGPNYGLVFKSI